MLIDSGVVKKLPAFYGTRRFTTVYFFQPKSTGMCKCIFDWSVTYRVCPSRQCNKGAPTLLDCAYMSVSVLQEHFLCRVKLYATASTLVRRRCRWRFPSFADFARQLKFRTSDDALYDNSRHGACIGCPLYTFCNIVKWPAIAGILLENGTHLETDFSGFFVWYRALNYAGTSFSEL
jgi:hypothetical protein